MSRDGDRAPYVDALYDAVVAPEIWPDVLHALARSVNAFGCCIAMEHASETLIAPPVSPDLKEPLEDFMESGWYLRDLRGNRGWPLFRGGHRVLIEHDVSTDDERRHGSYHNEWLRPWDLPWWAAVGFSCEDRLYGLAILRSSRQGPFTSEEAKRLASLQPHLARVAGLAEQLSFRRAETALDVLALIDRAAFLLDARGRIARLNPRAEALIGQDFALRHGVLRAIDRDSDRRLQHLISAVLAPPFPSAAPEEEPVAIRRFGRKPLIVRALPTVGLLSDVLVHTRALLLITDPEARAIPSTDTLRQIFGLTSAEAVMVRRLAAGEALKQAAEALGISVGTARVHLKAIFAKTEIHRQSELISLIQRIGAV